MGHAECECREQCPRIKVFFCQPINPCEAIEAALETIIPH